MTTNPTAATAAIHYHAGHNMPGYLPESDVETYTDIGDAIDGTIETLRTMNYDTDITEYSEMDEARDAAWDAYPFEAFLDGYEEAADGDSTYETLVGEDRADDDYIIGWHTSTMEAFRSDCLDFAQDNVLDLVTSGLDPRRAGMDFWLTRNRHGAGYWDEDYGKPSDVTAALARLTDASHAYGSAELYVGDDGWIYQA